MIDFYSYCAYNSSLWYHLKEPSRKRSQSEWNISDTSSSGESRLQGFPDTDEACSFLPQPLSTTTKCSEPTNSQYFNALEKIQEVEDFDPSEDVHAVESYSSDDNVSYSSSSSWETNSEVSIKGMSTYHLE